MDLQKLSSNFAATENRPKGFQDSAFTALSDSNPPQLGPDLVQERDAEMGFDRCLNAPILMSYQKNLKREGWPAEGRNGVTKVCSRGHWRPQEDARLKELVNKFGPHNWNLIAQSLQGRSGKSCRLRWFNQLDPRINRRAFSEEEEERLLSAHKMYGNKWATIARMFPGRTDNAVKNHWHVIMARKRREEHCVYRRKMPSSSFSFLHLQLQQNTHQSTNNVNINIVDDQLSAASTCTHLSLTPSSLKTPHFLTRFHHQDLLYSPAGKEGKGPENQDDDQLGYSSESKSEVCAASESVANNEANLYMCGEDESGKFDMGFIDFLGVGAT